MTDILYSIIIPHKNSPELLKRCIGSIPSRDDVQVIVVDDNSDPEIVDFKKIQFTRDVEVYDVDYSKWGGHARNIGLSKAIGKWILFSDCDDYFEDGFLDVLDKYSNENFDVIFYDFNLVDSISGSKLSDSYLDKIHCVMHNYDGSDYLSDFIKYKIHTVWSKMVSRNFVVANNIPFEEIQNGNDIMFSFLVGYYSKNIKVIPRALYNYTYDRNSVSRKKGYTRHYWNVVNSIKRNSFYDFIGHPEWKSNIIRKIFAPLKNDGFSIFFQTIWHLLRNLRYILSLKKYYINRL